MKRIRVTDANPAKWGVRRSDTGDLLIGPPLIQVEPFVEVAGKLTMHITKVTIDDPVAVKEAQELYVKLLAPHLLRRAARPLTGRRTE